MRGANNTTMFLDIRPPQKKKRVHQTRAPHTPRSSARFVRPEPSSLSLDMVKKTRELAGGANIKQEHKTTGRAFQKRPPATEKARAVSPARILSEFQKKKHIFRASLFRGLIAVAIVLISAGALIWLLPFFKEEATIPEPFEQPGIVETFPSVVPEERNSPAQTTLQQLDQDVTSAASALPQHIEEIRAMDLPLWQDISRYITEY